MNRLLRLFKNGLKDRLEINKKIKISFICVSKTDINKEFISDLIEGLLKRQR